MTFNEMWAGNSLTVPLTITDPAGAAVDLASSAVVWQLAISPADPALVTKSTGGGGVTIIDAAAGECEITLDPADTADLAGVYYQEAQVTDPAGHVTTVDLETPWLTIKPSLIA